MADTTPPVVASLTPLPGAVNVLVAAGVSFSVLDQAEPGVLPQQSFTLADHFPREDLSSQIDGVTSTFTLSAGYQATSLAVYIDGIRQNGVTELSPTAGTFQLSSIPASGSLLVARYTKFWDVNSVNLDTVKITLNGVVAFQTGAWTLGHAGTITPIDFGYQIAITTHPDFTKGTTVDCVVECSDIAGNAMAPYTWSFSIESSAVGAHRRPYLTALGPQDGQLGVGPTTAVQFTIKTDDIAASFIDQNSVMVQLNGTPIVVGGVDQAGYTTTFTPASQQLALSIVHPTFTLDRVYQIDVQANDDLLTVGGGSFQFSTGAAGWALATMRQEPLLCPIDNVPVPLLVDTGVSTTQYGDAILSVTADWWGRYAHGQDCIEIPSGADQGFWVLRDPYTGAARLWHTNQATASGLEARTFSRQLFADRSPVSLVFSPLMRYAYQKVWGDVPARYWGGFPSDLHFPVGFEQKPQSNQHDSVNFPSESNGGVFDDETRLLTFSLPCDQPVGTNWDRYSITTDIVLRTTQLETATLTNGSATVLMSGSLYRTNLQAGARVRFGTDTTVYEVVGINLLAEEITINVPWPLPDSANQTVTRLLAGTRTLTTFQLSNLTEGGEFFVGLAATEGPSTGDGANRAGASLVRTAQGIALRAHLGPATATVQTDLTAQRLIDQEWIIETEMQDESTLRARILDPLNLMDVPPTRSVEVQQVGSVVWARWSLTTLATGGTPGALVEGQIRFVDVEPGQGAPYQQGATLSSGNAKARAPRNVYPLDLSGQGWRDIKVSAAVVPTSYTAQQTGLLFLDTDETVAVVESFSIDGGQTITVQAGTPLARAVQKFSYQTGFDRLHVTFRASKRGFWYAVANGTDPRADVVLAGGVYDNAGSAETFEIVGDALASFGDGLQSLNIVVCKEPVPPGLLFLNGQTSITVGPQVIRTDSAHFIGEASLQVRHV